MNYLIKIDNLTYEPLFHQFNLNIVENSFVAIAGTNNCGKTTLIKIIAGLLPTKNTICMNYSYLNYNNKVNLYSNIAAIIPREKYPFLFERVLQELAFPLENIGLSPSEIKERIYEIACEFDFEKSLNVNPNELTYSMQIKVQLAVSLITKPKLLLLDDIFSLLSRKETNEIITVLKKYQKQGLTIIMTTDNLTDTLEADYLYILKQGNIILEGKPLAVLQEDKILTKLGLKLPFMVELSLKLQFYNLLNYVETDMKRLVDILWK